MSERALASINWLEKPSRRTDWWVATGLFVLTLAVSWVFWSLLPGAYQTNQSTDYSGNYEPIARNIAAGLGITLDGEIATRYPPGFSVALAAAFRTGDALGVGEEAALLWLRLLSAGLATVLLYILARLVWPPLGGLIVGLAWATYPFGLWLTKQPNSEIVFIPLFFASVYLLWRALLRSPRAWWLYLGAGLLSGAAMLVRPVGIGLGFVFVLQLMIFARKTLSLPARVGFSAVILLGNLLAVGPWEAAVYRQTGEVIPLSTGGPVSIKDGLTFLIAPKEYRREVEHSPDVEAFMAALLERRPEMQGTGGIVTITLEEAGRAPLAALKFTGIKAARSWFGTDSREFEGITLGLQLVYFALAFWGSWYAWRRGGDLRQMIAGNWMLILYFWAMTIIVVPLLRYTLPAMGLVMMALPGVYYALIGRWSRMPSSPALPADQ
jgi:hypothetical protein